MTGMENYDNLANNYGDYLTAAQAAEYLAISENLVYTLLKKRQLKGRKIGRSWRITKARIIEYLER
jgi:excisionase family DNA binding protein